MSEEEASRLHAIIHGRVQGVGFRAFVIDKGITIGVTGWARNKWDGTVEVIAEGEHQQLEQLLTALHRGPSMANVTQVDVDWQTAKGEFSSFHVRSTF
ncbi:MAG: acylphosphatase [Anaerolineales bacterium]